MDEGLVVFGYERVMAFEGKRNSRADRRSRERRHDSSKTREALTKQHVVKSKNT